MTQHPTGSRMTPPLPPGLESTAELKARFLEALRTSKVVKVALVSTGMSAGQLWLAQHSDPEFNQKFMSMDGIRWGGF